MEEQKEGRTDGEETKGEVARVMDLHTVSANEEKQTIATKRKEGKREGRKRVKSIFKEKKKLPCKLC